jgi:hypothetical protein
LLLSPIGPGLARNPDPGTGAWVHPAAPLPASCCYHQLRCFVSRFGAAFPGSMCGIAAPIMGDAALEQAPDGGTAGQLQGSGKGPELALRTGSRLAGRELSLRCLLGAQVPSQAQPPVQPVPRSSPSRRTGPEAAGCPSLRPDAVRGGQPSPASQPRAELWGEIYRASKRCQPSKSLLYVCIVPPDRRKSPKVITERSQMRDREQQPSQWRWPRPEAPRARPRPTARAPDRPGRPRWPRR